MTTPSVSTLPQVDFPERTVIKLLRSDLITLEHLLESNPEAQWLRRCHVRASFALIESLINYFKAMSHNLATQLILPMQQQLGAIKNKCPVKLISQELSSSEIALLRDEEIRVKTNGDVEYGRSTLDFKRNTKFALRTACRVFGIPFLWDLEHDSGWSSLVKAAEIRNRLLHPRPDDIVVLEDSEIECVRAAYFWVISADMLFTARAYEGAAGACADVLVWIRDFAPEHIEQLKQDIQTLEIFRTTLNSD